MLNVAITQHSTTELVAPRIVRVSFLNPLISLNFGVLSLNAAIFLAILSGRHAIRINAFVAPPKKRSDTPTVKLFIHIRSKNNMLIKLKLFAK